MSVNYTKVYPTAENQVPIGIINASSETGFSYESKSRTDAKSVLGISVSVKDYGAVGDGITDDGSVIQIALSATTNELLIPSGEYYFGGTLVISSNKVIKGLGRNSILYPDNATGETINITGNNVIIKDLAIVGDAPAVINVYGDNCTIENVHFETNGTKLGQCIRLFDCENITIKNCTFDGTGYGVIQSITHVSDNVLITGCFAENMVADFIEANCASTAPSKNWTISNNIYKGSAYYDLAVIAEAAADYTTYRENRFVGITAVSNVVITGNIVENVAGDAAIHVEDVGTSLVITDNIFDNILGHGYITIAPTDVDVDDNECIISGNTFLRSDSTSEIGNVLYTSGDRYINEILFSNNRIVGSSTTNNLKMSLISQTNIIIINNTFRYCTTAIHAPVLRFGKINGNTFRDCDIAMLIPAVEDSELCDNLIFNCVIGFDLSDGTTSYGGAQDTKITGNRFDTISGYNLISRRNNLGTTPPRRMFVANNIFSENLGATTYAVRITGNTPTGALATQNCTLINNIFKTGATIEMTGDYLIKGNNIFNDKEMAEPMYAKGADISSTPEFVGLLTVDSGNIYVSKGTSSSADWVQVNN